MAALIRRSAKPTKYILGFPSPALVTGLIALFVAGGSAYLIAGTSAVHCDSLAPVTVLATLAAFLISVCFRQMGRFPERRARWLLLVWLLIAAGTLFGDFRFVRQYRGFCDQLRQEFPHGNPAQ